MINIRKFKVDFCDNFIMSYSEFLKVLNHLIFVLQKYRNKVLLIYTILSIYDTFHTPSKLTINEIIYGFFGLQLL